MRKGFAAILILGLLAAVTALITTFYFKVNNGSSNPFTVSKKFGTVDIQQEKSDAINLYKDLSNKYKQTKLISQEAFGGVYREGSFWKQVNGKPEINGLTLNSDYKNQTINGIKNMLVILNKTRPIDFPSNENGLNYIGFSKTYIQDYEKVVISANKKIISGSSLSSLTGEEKSAYILANPSVGSDVMKEQRYLDAFGVVKNYIINQNESLFSQIKGDCDSENSKNLKNYCYAVISALYVDNFDCNLIEGDFPEYKSVCEWARAIEDQNLQMCELAGTHQDYCKKNFLAVGANIFNPNH